MKEEIPVGNYCFASLVLGLEKFEKAICIDALPFEDLREVVEEP